MKQSSMCARVAIFLGLLACASWQVGCGAKAPPTGSVSGKVTYKGQPLTTGVVTFINEKAGSGASGEIDASGSYWIASIRTGEYNVAVQQCPPSPSAGPEAKGSWKLNIPDKYQALETSGLTAMVKEGKNTADFAL
jgi:hypothetical protein